MTARELFSKMFNQLQDVFDILRLPVVYIDEASGAEVEIVDAILENGKIKLISKFTKDESGL